MSKSYTNLDLYDPFDDTSNNVLDDFDEFEDTEVIDLSGTNQLLNPSSNMIKISYYNLAKFLLVVLCLISIIAIILIICTIWTIYH